MKRTIIGLAVAAVFATANVNAQDNAGGGSAGSSASGEISTGVITAAAVTGVFLAAATSNSSGFVSTPPPGPGPTPSCEGADELVDGVCIGTTVTVTVTGTGATTTVPVTYTYAPSV